METETTTQQVIMTRQRTLARRAWQRIRIAALSLGSTHLCPLCGWTGSAFLTKPYPHKPAPCRVCPRCRSFERHRFSQTVLNDLLPAHGDRVLHIAPEPMVADWLKGFAKAYLSIDLASPLAMRHMDITALDLPDASFSLIYCSHVLEHIPDDAKAMAELRRVLRPDGLAVIMVPIRAGATYEDPAITSPQQRLIHFQQEDHVRIYGLDLVDRLAAAGFATEVLRVSDYPAEDAQRMGWDYPSTREIFLARPVPALARAVPMPAELVPA